MLHSWTECAKAGPKRMARAYVLMDLRIMVNEYYQCCMVNKAPIIILSASNAKTALCHYTRFPRRAPNFQHVAFCQRECVSDNTPHKKSHPLGLGLELDHNGLHTPEEFARSPQIQICWGGPFSGVSLCPEAFLQQCCYQVLSYVYGVGDAFVVTYLFS